VGLPSETAGFGGWCVPGCLDPVFLMHQVMWCWCW